MDVAAIPKNPQHNPPSRRRRTGLALALASACVFSVALIGHTHPPFPAPKVRRRDADGGLGALEVKSRWFSPWGTIFGHVGARYKTVHADRLEQTDRRGFMHLRTKYWRDGRFRLSDAGIKSIVAAIEAHRNPAAAWPLWFGVAVLVVGALAALSFIRRSEDPHHSHLK